MKVVIILLAIGTAFVLFLRYLAKQSKSPGEGTHIKYYTPEEEKGEEEEMEKFGDFDHSRIDGK